MKKWIRVSFSMYTHAYNILLSCCANERSKMKRDEKCINDSFVTIISPHRTLINKRKLQVPRDQETKRWNEWNGQLTFVTEVSLFGQSAKWITCKSTWIEWRWRHREKVPLASSHCWQGGQVAGCRGISGRKTSDQMNMEAWNKQEQAK